jgi:hypothetical protein
VRAFSAPSGTLVGGLAASFIDEKASIGIDGQTIADVEQYGVTRLLDELAAELKEGRWQALPARRVFIPKPGRSERRPLSISAVRDERRHAAAAEAPWLDQLLDEEDL